MTTINSVKLSLLRKYQVCLFFGFGATWVFGVRLWLVGNNSNSASGEADFFFSWVVLGECVDSFPSAWPTPWLYGRKHVHDWLKIPNRMRGKTKQEKNAEESASRVRLSVRYGFFSSRKAPSAEVRLRSMGKHSSPRIDERRKR